MLHRQLAMSKEQTTYQQTERSAAMMRSTLVASLAKNQMSIFHSSPADFMHTQEESTDLQFSWVSVHTDKQTLAWRDSSRRKPLLITGVRQCGKTHTLKEFGSTYFDNVCYVNLESSNNYAAIFDYDFDTRRIVREIELMEQCPIIPGKTLLIFDEIQEVPRAITALKYSLYGKFSEFCY